MNHALLDILPLRRQQWREAHERLDLAIARQYGLYHDDAAVEAAGVRGILQMFLLAPDDATHVERFLAFCDFPKNAHILDCGCGTGEMDALMQHQRPDLRLTLLNRSMAQLRCCPRQGRVSGDMQLLPFPESSFDAMLLCYTLGYGPIDAVLDEAARVIRPGGTFVLADMVCVSANQDTGAEALLLLLGYKCYGRERIDEAVDTHGFTCMRSASATYLHPMVQPLWTAQERHTIFRDVVANVSLFQRSKRLPLTATRSSESLREGENQSPTLDVSVD